MTVIHRKSPSSSTEFLAKTPRTASQTMQIGILIVIICNKYLSLFFFFSCRFNSLSQFQLELWHTTLRLLIAGMLLPFNDSNLNRNSLATISLRIVVMWHFCDMRPLTKGHFSRDATSLFSDFLLLHTEYSVQPVYSI